MFVYFKAITSSLVGIISGGGYVIIDVVGVDWGGVGGEAERGRGSIEAIETEVFSLLTH